MVILVLCREDDVLEELEQLNLEASKTTDTPDPVPSTTSDPLPTEDNGDAKKSTKKKSKGNSNKYSICMFGYVVILFFDSQTDVDQLVQAIEGMDISKTVSSGDAVTTEEESGQSGAQSHVKTKAEKKEAKKEKERRQKEMKKQSKQSTNDTPGDTASSSVSLDSAIEQSVDLGKAEGDSVNANSNPMPDPATASTVDPSLSVVEPVTGSEPLVTSSQATGEDVAEDVEDDKDDDNDDKKKKKKKKKKTDKEEDKKATKVCMCVCLYLFCTTCTFRGACTVYDDFCLYCTFQSKFLNRNLSI